jgi:tripartite-type tricarboxylate transporter receptor subunit TctC
MEMKKPQLFRIRFVTLFVIGVLAPAWPWSAEAQRDVDFKGKTVRIIVGTSTGGGVDLYARLIAQFLGRHLPGEPTVIVQNMPGASSLVAANFVYNMSKPDGLTLGALQGGPYFDQILGRDGEVRVVQVYVDRLARAPRSPALYESG